MRDKVELDNFNILAQKNNSFFYLSLNLLFMSKRIYR